MRSNSLFLIDKWCSTNPNLGFSPLHNNLIQTFLQSQINTLTHTLHYDESAVYGVHIDSVLRGYCQKFGIDTIFIAFMGNSPLNPSVEILASLKQMGIKLCVFWSDNNPLDIELRNRLDKIVDLHVMMDNARSPNFPRIENEKYLYLWSPENGQLYFPDTQDIAVSFIGSTRYPDRAMYVNQLQLFIPNILIAGGQREQALSAEAYAKLIRKSQIGINFSKNPMGHGYEQTKGRVFAVIASRSLLLEEKGSSASDFFKPGQEYVEFDSIEDLVNKIKYYSFNVKEREEIALNGYNKFVSNYTSSMFWDKVIEKLK